MSILLTSECHMSEQDTPISFTQKSRMYYAEIRVDEKIGSGTLILANCHSTNEKAVKSSIVVISYSIILKANTHVMYSNLVYGVSLCTKVSPLTNSIPILDVLLECFAS